MSVSVKNGCGWSYQFLFELEVCGSSPPTNISRQHEAVTDMPPAFTVILALNVIIMICFVLFSEMSIIATSLHLFFLPGRRSYSLPLK